MPVINKRYLVYAHAPASSLECIHEVAHCDRLTEAVETAQRWSREQVGDPYGAHYKAEKLQVAIYQLVEVIKDELADWERTAQEETHSNE